MSDDIPGVLGQRGMFPGRQSYGVQDYFIKANEETLLMVLIEDIIDSGNTIEYLYNRFKDSNVNDLKIFSLLFKMGTTRSLLLF